MGRRAWCAWAVPGLVSAAALSGCGASQAGFSVATHPVGGQVLLADGRPLGAGRVVFVPEAGGGAQAVGVLDAEGRFTLSTLRDGDGAAEGRYRVMIEPEAGPAAAKRVPARYTTESTSDLTAEVRAGENTLKPFRLKAR